jgi:peptidyl-prolyl cis-trans isomerase C
VVTSLAGLLVSPSQAAVHPAKPADAVNAERFTAYAQRTLEGDPKAEALRSLALNQTLEHSLLQAAERSVSRDAIAAYYQQHIEHFLQPAAIALWRLLLATEQEARAAALTLQKSDEPVRTWAALIRERSLDKATHFRRGALGYVRPDGSTDVPQVRVSPSLYVAARSLKDGEFSTTPVTEGPNWALLWRRDSRPAQGRSLSEADAEIRQQLALAQARTAHSQLTRLLRDRYLTEFHPEHLTAFTPQAEPVPETPKQPIVSRPAARSPVPHHTDLGDR